MPVDCGWLESFTKLVDVVCEWVWGLPLVGAILVTGLVLTLCLRFTHVFNLKRAFVYMFHTEEGDDVSGEVSSFAALCTALSATIGTGNIVGVATAIGTGGPGALFWMEVAAFRVFYVAVVFVGPYLTVSVVWGMADVFNGLMAFPNLIALLLLSPVVARTTADFFRRTRQEGVRQD